MAERDTQDPYAPPPRHRDRSGALVRLVIVAGLLGAAAWGYTEFSRDAGPSLVAEQGQTQTLAERDSNAGYTVTPTPDVPADPTAEELAEDQPPA